MRYTFIIFIFAFSSCSFLRKVRKQETRTDSTKVATVDSAWLKKAIEQSQYTKTTDRITIQLPYDSLRPINYQATDDYLKAFIAAQQAANAAGNKLPPINIYPPGTTIIKDRIEETGQQTKASSDEGEVDKKETTHDTTMANSKVVDEKAGPDWKFFITIGLIALAVIFVYFRTRK